MDLRETKVVQGLIDIVALLDVQDYSSKVFLLAFSHVVAMCAALNVGGCRQNLHLLPLEQTLNACHLLFGVRLNHHHWLLEAFFLFLAYGLGNSHILHFLGFERRSLEVGNRTNGFLPRIHVFICRKLRSFLNNRIISSYVLRSTAFFHFFFVKISFFFLQGIALLQLEKALLELLDEKHVELCYVHLVSYLHLSSSFIDQLKQDSLRTSVLLVRSREFTEKQGEFLEEHEILKFWNIVALRKHRLFLVFLSKLSLQGVTELWNEVVSLDEGVEVAS